MNRCSAAFAGVCQAVAAAGQLSFLDEPVNGRDRDVRRIAQFVGRGVRKLPQMVETAIQLPVLLRAANTAQAPGVFPINGAAFRAMVDL